MAATTAAIAAIAKVPTAAAAVHCSGVHAATFTPLTVARPQRGRRYLTSKIGR